ncbi:ribosome small subunit-dependent GTPase A [Lactobacillus sp. CC-MHH1034]|uniref:ribosome small subunit-dependent GTPase A n=1 Tax=Agrilactobacillus fermenti TaxID=2586909 RepID=UPI001E4981B5|nr:ribosome small subunit-dependent GTPase A [Agrilactobacillus fermenti]MCD2256224.1 ribosome small subunit-dependent GTPase A [Agrilactobacillus fermenti]
MKSQGKIIKLTGGFYYVLAEDKVYQTRARGNFRSRKIKPVVGDNVVFESTNSTDGYILEILPAKNRMVRPPLANIDLMVIVTSLITPNFQPNLLDRFLVTQEFNDLKAVIYVTKSDLIHDQQQLQNFQNIFDYYQNIGYATIFTSDPFSDEGLQELARLINGKVTAVTGQSGAGKSTLLNHLVPELKLPTSAISQSLNRGKHTTRHVELHQVAGGLIADTPGFSNMALPQIPLERIKNLFPEFMAFSPQCRFRECQHINEPDCAVKAAVVTGEILTSRYESYQQFRQEVQQQKRY